MDETLVQHDYLRQRLHPQPGDQFYLHLADLRQALEQHRSDAPLHILDYGCGGSPYRTLFPNAVRYVRADLAGTPEIDHAFRSDSRLPEIASTSFDLILSTQVLEHVADPAAYLAEALRLLRPGGKLLLSTHGTFPDHGCPHDYWRWTADGLALSLKQAGFSEVTVTRLTCGRRAVAFMLTQMLTTPSSASSGLASFSLRALSFLVRRHLAAWDGLLDHLTQQDSVRRDHQPMPIDHSIGLLAVAQRPAI